MMLALSNNTRIFAFSGPTDMRKGFNGLSGLVAEHFDVELLSGHLFLFCNRRRDRIKLLYWDQDGLAIWYKRLEAENYQLPELDSDNDSFECHFAPQTVPPVCASNGTTFFGFWATSLVGTL